MSSPTSLTRWRQYAKERSPIGALLFIGFSQTLASQGALRAGWSIPRLLIGTVGIAAFMVLMRLMDEKKDFKKDQIANPTRPLPRGLISVDEISKAVRIVTSFLIILASCLYFFGYARAAGFLPFVSVSHFSCTKNSGCPKRFSGDSTSMRFSISRSCY